LRGKLEIGSQWGGLHFRQPLISAPWQVPFPTALPCASCRFGVKTEIGPRNPDFRSSLNSNFANARQFEKCGHRPRLADLGCWARRKASINAETLGQKINCNHASTYGTPRTAGAATALQGAATATVMLPRRAVLSFRSGRYRLLVALPWPSETDDAMPKSTHRGRRSNSQAPEFKNDWRGVRPANTPQSLPVPLASRYHFKRHSVWFNNIWLGPTLERSKVAPRA